MALLNPSNLTPDEKRAAEVEDAFNGTKAAVAGFKPVRRVTALVVEILRRANNLFVTGEKGFQAIGVSIKQFQKVIAPMLEDGKPNPDFDPGKAGAIVPKIAEVIALLTCSDDEMDACDDDPKHLDKLRRNIMRNRTLNEIMESMADVQAEFTKINRSTAVVEDEPTPGELEPDAKKKHGPASEPA